ncbi:MFS transporter [Microlunatus speluncae]|uniref:MFS transporter n=1 Tax=Microlunatus speluncae TaxID=2594267 RepID=UPI001C2CC827|nr:MFS transporter [Microlunatus speluncae]
MTRLNLAVGPLAEPAPGGVFSTGRTGARPGPILAVSSVGTFLALVAFTLPLADLPTIVTVLGAGPAESAWILSSMSVGLAAALLIAGRLADDYGRRRMFLIGCAVLALGSFAALLPSAPVFIAGRIVAGIGGAAITLASLGLIAAGHQEPARRAAATGVWGAVLGAGIAAGPLLAGVAHLIGAWWSAYLVVGVAAVAAAIMAWVSLAESRVPERQRVDLVGGVIFVAAMVVSLTGLVWLRLAAQPYQPILVIIGGALLFVVFVIIELRVAQPMLDPRLFRGPRFTGQVVAGFTTGIGIIALCSVSITFLISGLGFTALAAAGTLALWSGTSVLTALLARPLAQRVGGGTQLAIGLLGVAAGQALMIPAHSFATIAPGLFLAGIASGVLNAGLGREAVASVPAGRGGFGSGVNNTARYLGSAIGVTITGILLLHGSAPSDPSGDQLTGGWTAAATVTAVLSALGGLTVLILDRAELRRLRAAVPRAGRTVG